MSDKPGIKTILRRRGGNDLRVTRIDNDGERLHTDLLTRATNHNDLLVNIRKAAERLACSCGDKDAGRVATTIDRRNDQDNVFRNTAGFLARICVGLEDDSEQIGRAHV